MPKRLTRPLIVLLLLSVTACSAETAKGVPVVRDHCFVYDPVPYQDEDTQITKDALERELFRYECFCQDPPPQPCPDR